MHNRLTYHTLIAFILLLYFSFFILIPPAFAAEQDVIVNEIMYDFPGSDTNHEWVELFNMGDDPVTIVGGSAGGSWRINDGTNHTFSSTPSQGSMTINAKDYVVIAQNANTFLADNPGFTGNLIESSGLSLNNTGATVGLRVNSDGILWGQITYRNSQGATGDGNSLQRKTDGSLIAALPTPGRQNATQPVPTPTLTPVPSPTFTSTPTPTKIPTPVPTTKSTSTPTSKPTSLPSFPSKEQSAGDSGKADLPLEILGESIAASSTPMVTNKPSNNPSATPASKILGGRESNLSKVLIGLGVISLFACGILTFRKLKIKSFGGE